MQHRSPLSHLPHLRIVVVNPSPLEEGDHDNPTFVLQAARSKALRIGLLQAGYDIIASLPADIYLPERIAQLQPDMIIVDTDAEARDVLEHVVIATRDAPRAIALFTEDTKKSSMQAAMAAGVSAYVVAGLQPDRIKPVLEVALLRFQQDQHLRTELLATKLKLAERKVVERAKGLLMARHHLAEPEAYQKLQRLAMEKNIKLVEVAQRIIDAVDLLG
ncbi:MAG: ANTAR domain-containing protein [Glaciimonas sp.]|nr:ANTAR domain-containing protein [Glaciimonas sp.]